MVSAGIIVTQRYRPDGVVKRKWIFLNQAQKPQYEKLAAHRNATDDQNGAERFLRSAMVSTMRRMKPQTAFTGQEQAQRHLHTSAVGRPKHGRQRAG